MSKTCTAVGCTNHNMMGKKFHFFYVSKTHGKTEICLSEDPDHSDYVPSVFETAKRYTTYVQQKKMVRYGNKKAKKSTEKLNTAVLGSPTPTQQTPKKNSDNLM
ncbi:hypothetical protein ACJMK2_026959 [Sinanodonta woodiana]|uniref:THAP-type domain-containing protein n=1 Tax=Sinanodonta woodiana TaxID=1069815 RepID=A0ABD3XPR5_SINWO